MKRRSGRPRRTIPGLLAWAVVAAVVAVGQLFGDGDDASSDTSTDSALEATQDSVPPPVAEAEHAPVRVMATPPPKPVEKPPASRRTLPQPFAAMHHFASPLIMPRLRLPRVLTPRLGNLSELLVRARPGEPVAVSVTAYCLDGITRRGQPVRPGIVAADPRIFPLARHVELFVGGRFLGRFLIDDTGGHVRGRRIDIWTPDCDDARRFGRRDGIATLVAR